MQNGKPSNQSSSAPFGFSSADLAVPYKCGGSCLEQRVELYRIWGFNHSNSEKGSKTEMAASRFATPTSASSWSPSQLLNPKGYDNTKKRKGTTPDTSLSVGEIASISSKSAPASPEFVFTTPGPDNSDESLQENDGIGLGNLIERVHNVSKRDDRPSKKQKTVHVLDDEADGPKAVFTGGSKNGEIGEYMRQKRQEGIQEAGPTSNSVDLTSSVVDLTEGTSLISWLRTVPI